ncbi:flagellar biosynthetic protein FliO [Microbacterium sp. T2.11-28]|uniref:flagellar biosynthetic protein FliO n=1 Tax=Microbacterium sp. T2.11-28 TaxID=3041169 RepID=UPI0025404BA6|nr:flagellar biosynthetic protein FliO [Microbacterium sp. T2.11-28]
MQRRVARGAAKERARDAVRVIARRGLGAKAQVVVVEIDDVRYVLGIGDGAVSVIDRAPAEAAAGAAIAPLTALPARPAPIEAADPAAPLPARRSLRAEQRTASRAASRTPSLPRDAAQALRRALGA